ncbi:hypothetical protein D3C83_195100 [compost metagenome]
MAIVEIIEPPPASAAEIDRAEFVAPPDQATQCVQDEAMPPAIPKMILLHPQELL